MQRRKPRLRELPLWGVCRPLGATEGEMDKAKGEAREALGDAKDAVKHTNDD